MAMDGCKFIAASGRSSTSPPRPATMETKPRGPPSLRPRPLLPHPREPCVVLLPSNAAAREPPRRNHGRPQWPPKLLPWSRSPKLPIFGPRAAARRNTGPAAGTPTPWIGALRPAFLHLARDLLCTESSLIPTFRPPRLTFGVPASHRRSTASPVGRRICPLPNTVRSPCVQDNTRLGLWVLFNLCSTLSCTQTQRWWSG